LAIKFLLDIDDGSKFLFCCLCAVVANVPLVFNGGNFLYFLIVVVEEKEFVLGRRVI
jgi:hypothetical protein